MTALRSGVSSFGINVLSRMAFLKALRVTPGVKVSFFNLAPPSCTEVIWISFESSEGSGEGSECRRKLRSGSEIWFIKSSVGSRGSGSETESISQSDSPSSAASWRVGLSSPVKSIDGSSI